MFEFKQYCKACGKTKPDGYFPEQWWSLKDYYKLYGLFCPDCYEKVSHDSYGKPNHPGEYLMMLLKFGIPNE